MQTGVTHSFYFGAGATSIGGHFKNPFRHIPTPSSVSLPAGGGLVSSQIAAPASPAQKEISYKSAYTFATGTPTAVNGPWTHRVVSVVEGFNLLDRLTADRLVAQVLVEYPAPGKGHGDRKISFAGSRFENLKVDGKTITPAIHSGFFPAGEAEVDPHDHSAWTTPTIPWKTLSSIAHKQGTARGQAESLPTWTHHRYSWVSAPEDSGQQNSAGYTLCSLVDSIDGLESGPNPSHCFELPDFGRVFLGEAMVYPHALNLAMIRVELGCDVSGQVTAASLISNGSTAPPS